MLYETLSSAAATQF